MASWTYWLLRVLPQVMLILTGVMALALLFDLASSSHASAGAFLLKAMSGLAQIAATAFTIAFAYWFRRMVELMFPEVIE